MKWLLGFFEVLFRPAVKPAPDEWLHVDATRSDEDDKNGKWLGYEGLYDDFKGPSRAIDFGLPESLQTRFRAWSRNYLDLEDRLDAGESVDFTDCNEEGWALAKEVKRYFPIRRVKYYDLVEEKDIDVEL